MDIETAANPADEAVTLVDERETAQLEGANTQAEDESGDLDALAREALGETQANPEFIEVEIDGKKLKVMAVDGTPLDPELKFGALRDADYRKKTMTLSEEKKAVQQERAFIQARANLEGDAALRARNLTALEAEIRQISQIPIQTLYEEGWTDEQIAEAQAGLQGKVAQRAILASQVLNDAQMLTQAQQAYAQQQREVAIQKAGMVDKALTPERISALEAFAINNGVPEEDAKTIADPVVYKMLHLAEIGQRFIERQRNAANFRAATAGSPTQTLGGVSAGAKSPENMSIDEMAKHLGY